MRMEHSDGLIPPPFYSLPDTALNTKSFVSVHMVPISQKRTPRPTEAKETAVLAAITLTWQLILKEIVCEKDLMQPLACVKD